MNYVCVHLGNGRRPHSHCNCGSRLNEGLINVKVMLVLVAGSLTSRTTIDRAVQLHSQGKCRQHCSAGDGND